MTDARLGEAPVNPMHAELLTRIGMLFDEYLADGMPPDNVTDTACVAVGLLLNHHFAPDVYSVAVEACVENIVSGLRV